MGGHAQAAEGQAVPEDDWSRHDRIIDRGSDILSEKNLLNYKKSLRHLASSSWEWWLEHWATLWLTHSNSWNTKLSLGGIIEGALSVLSCQEREEYTYYTGIASAVKKQLDFSFTLFKEMDWLYFLALEWLPAVAISKT